MAIVTLRLNQEEEKVLGIMVKYFDEDKSKILKEAMWEKFEELRDRDIIEDFEIKSKSGKIEFVSADDFVAKLQGKKEPSRNRRNELKASVTTGNRMRKRTTKSQLR